MTPITSLLWKHTKLAWMPEAQEAFKHLKMAFTTAAVFTHSDPNQPFTLENNATNFTIRVVLAQKQGLNQEVHPRAFYSHKQSPTKLNYEISDKELLAIKATFESWRHYLVGVRHPVQVFTDHKNLEYLCTAKALT